MKKRKFNSVGLKKILKDTFVFIAIGVGCIVLFAGFTIFIPYYLGEFIDIIFGWNLHWFANWLEGTGIYFGIVILVKLWQFIYCIFDWLFPLINEEHK